MPSNVPNSPVLAPVGEPPVPRSPARTSPGASSVRPALTRFGVFLLLLTAAFAQPWSSLLRDAANDRLHSYAVGIPFICAWLVWMDRARSRDIAPRRDGIPAVLLAVAGFAAALAGVFAARAGIIVASSSWLATQMLGWVLLAWAGAFWFLGGPLLRAHAFAAGFLIFTVPMPEPMVNAVEIGLQHASAWMVELVFRIGDITYLRDERAFWLPGLRFEVAQECSGIRSTVVLFITSVLGGHLLLRSAWRKIVIALLILPLGVARNTLRICTIALLSAHVDPAIIDSPLHHKGGPLFFAVSLIPLFLILWWFRHQESGDRNTLTHPGEPPQHESA